MQVILNKSDKIEQTVSMPCYKANEIAWLSMESLCNQININYHWELLICEEKHEKMIGVDFFKDYIERLYSAGCRRIVYILVDEWIPLIHKWKMLGEAAHKNSKSFLLKAVDCYSPSKRLSITHDIINKRKYQWVDFRKGYFYDFRRDKLIIYDSLSTTNLNMGFRTEYARNIPFAEKRKGIDGFLYKLFKIRKKYTVGSLYHDSIDTDGYNNISKRSKYYKNPVPPFFGTERTIEDLSVPEYVKKKIKLMAVN